MLAINEDQFVLEFLSLFSSIIGKNKGISINRRDI